MSGYTDQPKAMLRKTIVHAELERQMVEEGTYVMSPEEELAFAIRHAERRCERMRILAGAERGPGSQWVKAMLDADILAMEILIKRAKESNAA